LRTRASSSWTGTLVTDWFSGYKATFERGVSEAGCMAHARRKFHELWANHGSKVGEQALRYFQVLFRIEEAVAGATTEERQRLRQRVPEGSATAKAIDYSLKRWRALAGADALHRRRRRADLQQLGRETNPADRARAVELVVRWQPARRQKGCGDHELGALGQDQRARPIRLSQRPTRAVADACGQPD
jgi:hypothetical protein